MKTKRCELSHRRRQCQSQGRTCCTTSCSGTIAYAEGYVSSYKNKTQLFQGFWLEHFKVVWSVDFQAGGTWSREWLTWCYPAAQLHTWLQTLAFYNTRSKDSSIPPPPSRHAGTGLPNSKLHLQMYFGVGLKPNWVWKITSKLKGQWWEMREKEP